MGSIQRHTGERLALSKYGAWGTRSAGYTLALLWMAHAGAIVAAGNVGSYTGSLLIDLLGMCLAFRVAWAAERLA